MKCPICGRSYTYSDWYFWRVFGLQRMDVALPQPGKGLAQLAAYIGMVN
jgi:hypothetical protein